MDQIEIVRYKDEDFEEISRFFTGNGWKEAPHPEVLSDTGFVAVRGTEKLAVGFMYKTNSNVFILEWTATNPAASLKDRTKAFKLLVRSVMKIAKELKPKAHVFQFTPVESIVRTYKRLGFTDAEKATILHWA